MKIDPKTLVQDFCLSLCIQCGTCTGGCPIKFRSPLNMRRLVRETYLQRDLPEVLGRPELWACTTCSTCSLRCPAGVKNVEMIMGIRNMLTRQGQVPPTIRDALEHTLIHGNPWGRFKDRRADWTKDLPGQPGIKTAGEQETDTLLYVGCTPSFDPRAQNIPKALVKIFQRVGFDYGLLGRKELCCGSEIRRMGEEALFKKLAKDNLSLFQKCGIKKIITISPHCYNAFKNDYPESTIRVFHYTQILSDLTLTGKLKPEKKLQMHVTYQDPCFLGKQNKIFDEPRQILASLPGLSFVEMDRSRERSLCCEGGGGRMWAEGGTTGSRNGEIRIQEALSLGTNVIATSCPFCLLTLEDAVKISGTSDRVMVRDISELVAETIDETA